MKRKITVALVGNPNSGKTTIFNNLTGARQHVGNYPGVTVESKDGSRRYGDVEMQIVDLPGTYSLTAYSADELVARNYIIHEKPDVIVDVVDSSNLERNLYLAVQLMELGAPLVLAFNMSDQARARGHEIDVEKLSGLLGLQIVNTVGHKGKGMKELLDAIVKRADSPDKETGEFKLDYGREIEKEIGQLVSMIKVNGTRPEGYNARWLAIKLLENDGDVRSIIDSKEVLDQVDKSVSRIKKFIGDHPETDIAGSRYGFISGACQEAVRSTIEIRHTMSDRIDTVVVNRLLGIPIFFGLMYLVFQLTFTLGDPFMGWIDGFFGWLSDVVVGWWPAGSESVLKSLLVDGIIGGVGGVLVFLPNILLLFLAIAILEDSGYMARAAFIMDRLMNKIGLHGKSFIPLLIGFGCTIPAIMATRTIENRRDRLTTMLVAPLMSCGARLPIYALIIPAFFPQVWHAPMLWIIYVTGVLLAIVSAKILRSTLFKGESAPFVMELPPYRMPTIKGVLIHMWERAWLYLKKAGTIILGISIILWAMTTFPGLNESGVARFEEERLAVEAGDATEEEKSELLRTIDNEEAETSLRYSIAGRIGHGMEPFLKPMGFDWKIGTALIGAFAAKEVFVAQMGIVYSIGEADEESETLREKLQGNYNPLIGFCIMLFCLVSAPCMATIAITKREANSWKWALFQLAALTVLAYLVTVIVYQFGILFGIGVG
ncbi:MAG: ferrous iron transport protein B [Deltaproteobacteria bacterium]|uniref:Ferrous iron transport protein B n=1 Tax=Candidatus Zymogenus saltonus TaxID=2844893 RepID=A0A9D8PNV2_9DELT|nr:ferrous iron transport protein B [Candidatus Zymogenus saltonus]